MIFHENVYIFQSVQQTSRNINHYISIHIIFDLSRIILFNISKLRPSIQLWDIAHDDITLYLLIVKSTKQFRNGDCQIRISRLFIMAKYLFAITLDYFKALS